MKTISKLCTTAALGMALLLATGASHVALAQDSAAAAITDKSAAGELAYWNQIKDSANASDFRTYLEAFPDGMFAEPALRRFEQAGGNKAELPAEVMKATTAVPDVEENVEQPVTTEKPKVTQSSKTKVNPAVKTKKVAKTKSSKVKTKRVVQTKKRPKAVTAVRPNRSKPKISAAKPPTQLCRKGRIVNGRCVVKRATPAGGGGGNHDPGGGWGGGGGGGGTGGSGGGWGG